MGANGSLAEKATQDIIHKIFREMEHDLRENAIPKLRGELTKGKVRWRGIVMCHNNTPSKIERWIEQRGNRISRIFTIDFTININNARTILPISQNEP